MTEESNDVARRFKPELSILLGRRPLECSAENCVSLVAMPFVFNAALFVSAPTGSSDGPVASDSVGFFLRDIFITLASMIVTILSCRYVCTCIFMRLEGPIDKRLCAC